MNHVFLWCTCIFFSSFYFIFYFFKQLGISGKIASSVQCTKQCTRLIFLFPSPPAFLQCTFSRSRLSGYHLEFFLTLNYNDSLSLDIPVLHPYFNNLFFLSLICSYNLLIIIIFFYVSNNNLININLMLSHNLFSPGIIYIYIYKTQCLYVCIMYMYVCMVFL